MVTDTFEQNCEILETELDWFYRVLDTRIRLYFDHDCEYDDVFSAEPPVIETDETPYAQVINHYEMTFQERLVFILALVPHIKPQLLDVFFTKNSANSRDFTEFGGRNGHAFQGFLPTAETALFLLAGDNLKRRLMFTYLFDSSHYFHSHNLISLKQTGENEPPLSGFLQVSRDILELVLTGNTYHPKFGLDFPAKKLETAMEWDDLVLDSHTMAQVMEIKAWIEHGDELLHELGLIRKLKPGYRSLFYGPPGTGKTLTASLLGKISGLDVYHIDLSMVVSKYIGETEKNLEKIFQQAEHKEWILFFDEADALFGKRTKISDAHDRYANQEVSYLLQRVEDYSGVVILATNLRSNLDDAFTRRFQSIIHFPMPKPRERLQIWEQSFSGKTSLTGDVNLQDIANEYELSGGSIMNVIRYATLMTLRRDERTITRGDIEEGIRKELVKEGKTA
ncbi:MAG: ATP-binding protein [Candidatus Marinimicrobia bacterium]|nr:ATP-binding protein [Candidatus Neomarinimicrobiota bacterium]MCF7829372.1 ATP-binding protein [Candidatus Neomarinimicrobiota bacterium]MCF7880858.1 ATP-binding protein [Candidatus Neomarinimicrobiota bacterium]